MGNCIAHLLAFSKQQLSPKTAILFFLQWIQIMLPESSVPNNSSQTSLFISSLILLIIRRAPKILLCSLGVEYWNKQSLLSPTAYLLLSLWRRLIWLANDMCYALLLPFFEKFCLLLCFTFLVLFYQQMDNFLKPINPNDPELIITRFQSYLATPTKIKH